MPRQSRQKYPQKLKETPADTVRGISLKLKHKLKPRTAAQGYYLDMLNESTITFAAGPAGTGKTWIATYVALEKLFNNEVDRIVVTKPIVEAADASIGFLPGEVDAKCAPYFVAIAECFEDHIGPAALKKLIDEEKIEFLPIAYGRGRTLKHSFVLADECQNLTRKGIKLLMTRIGEGSFMCLNGDDDQCDLPNQSQSGFQWALTSLTGKSADIAVVEFSTRDIQRHPLIELIIKNLK